MQIPDVNLDAITDPAAREVIGQLLNLIETLVAENQALRAENQQLRDENARLKRLVAELTLDKHILGEVVRKKL